MPTVLPHDRSIYLGFGGGFPSGQLRVSGDGGQPLIFFLGTGRVFLLGRLNDPCRGRRWGLVVTPHPVIKISFFVSFCLVMADNLSFFFSVPAEFFCQGGLMTLAVVDAGAW